MFLHLSVSHSVDREGSASVHAGIPYPPGADTRPEQRPPGSRHPPEQTPLGADTPWNRPPGTRHNPLRTRHPPGSRDSYCCRWYASYWNAFLLVFRRKDLCEAKPNVECSKKQSKTTLYPKAYWWGLKHSVLKHVLVCIALTTLYPKA